jgi:GAF domain-containing protein
VKSVLETEKLARTFVSLADTLVDDFDVLDVLHELTVRCAELLEAAAAGLLLADRDGQLRVMVASTESARLLELFELQNDEGPCLECYRSGEPVSFERLHEAQTPWPRFASAATEAGYTSVLALPMRLRGPTIGSLNLFGDATGAPLGGDVIHIAQGMADVATIAIMQDRLARDRNLLAEQLQLALDSRVAIEQAKGALANRLGIGTDEAFDLLRQRARSTRQRLVQVAEEAVQTDAGTDWVSPAHAKATDKP